jgi:hypothetical protein
MSDMIDKSDKSESLNDISCDFGSSSIDPMMLSSSDMENLLRSETNSVIPNTIQVPLDKSFESE